MLIAYGDAATATARMLVVLVVQLLIDSIINRFKH